MRSAPQDADRSRADIPASGPHSGALRLLKGISGVFRPGVLTALMGASGAGASPLAGRRCELGALPREQSCFVAWGPRRLPLLAAQGDAPAASTPPLTTLAGKTTLMDTLADRKTSGLITGDQHGASRGRGCRLTHRKVSGERLKATASRGHLIFGPCCVLAPPCGQ